MSHARLLWSPTRKQLRVRGATLRCEAEVREGALAVPVTHELRDLAVVDVEKPHSLCLHPSEIKPAHLASTAVAGEHEHRLTVKLAALVRLDSCVLPPTQEV